MRRQLAAITLQGEGDLCLIAVSISHICVEHLLPGTEGTAKSKTEMALALRKLAVSWGNAHKRQLQCQGKVLNPQTGDVCAPNSAWVGNSGQENVSAGTVK